MSGSELSCPLHTRSDRLPVARRATGSSLRHPIRDRVEADLISEDSNRAYVRRGSLVGEIACMAVMGVMVTVLAVILLLAVRRLQRR